MDISKYTEKIFDDISNETSKYMLTSFNNKESRQHKIKIMSLYGTNLWLLNNGDETVNSADFRDRVDSFSYIINSTAMKFAQRKAHLASSIDDYLRGDVVAEEIKTVFLDNGISFSDRLDFIKLSNSSYKSAIDSMESLKSDTMMQQEAKRCHYQFYSNEKLKQMGANELYVLLSANQLVLEKLNEISDDMEFTNRNESTTLKRR